MEYSISMELSDERAVGILGHSNYAEFRFLYYSLFEIGNWKSRGIVEVTTKRQNPISEVKIKNNENEPKSVKYESRESTNLAFVVTGTITVRSMYRT
jgi:hypothetical protein